MNRKYRKHPRTFPAWALAASVTATLAACGGNGGDGSPPDDGQSAAPGDNGADTTPPEVDPDPTLPPSTSDFTPRRPEFEAIAKRLEGGSNPFLGLDQVRVIQRQLQDANLPPRARVARLAQLCLEFLRLGRIDSAINRIDEAFEIVAANPELGVSAPDLHRLRALIYLRQAEIANCIDRHNGDCCVFPIQDGGVHTDLDPARNALNTYIEYLDLERAENKRLSGRWLLNIAAMALGEHPDAVPPALQIPSSAFESEYEIPRFPDIAPRLGIDAFNLCGGCIVDDFDGDGLLDIVTSTWDPRGPLHYYRNSGDGTFEDRSALSHADDQLGGLNCIGGDYDNDGDVDVLVLRGAWLFDDGQIRNSLLQNDGTGVFTDVTHAAGLADPARPTQAATWLDYDNDGDLDLFIGNESRVEFPEPNGGNYPSQLFRNNGDGTFTDVASAAGATNDRYCKGVSAGDYDNDGDTDLYLSNLGPNRLYRNNGDGTFTDVAPQLGVSAPTGRSFVPWFFDFNNDGWLDIYVNAYDSTLADVARDALGMRLQSTPPALYLNKGDGTFTYISETAGLIHPYQPMGASFGDLDNDGFLDIYLGTGEPDFQSLMPNVMLRNDAGRRFQNVTRAGGFGHLQKGHGVAFVDLDNDGDQDVYHQLGGMNAGDQFYNAFFHNPGNDHHWLRIHLAGRDSNRAGVGARIAIVIETPDGDREIHRAVGSVSSFGGSPRRQEIGLGDATAVRSLTITWPRSGTRQVFENVPLDAVLLITEGADEYEILAQQAIKF